jgi:hypothetical protein
VDVTAAIDEFGRLICTMQADGRPVVVTAAHANQARTELLEAIGQAESDGYSECVWPEATGEYRWMLRRADDRLTVVAMWSSGTLTGWQHVLRTETGFQEFAGRLRAALASALA